MAICYDYRGLSAITRPAVEPLPHIDALLDGTRGSRFFNELDLASSYHQLRLRAAGRWKTRFRSQLGQFEGKVVPLGLQEASLLLTRVMNQALTVLPSRGVLRLAPRHVRASRPSMRGSRWPWVHWAGHAHSFIRTIVCCTHPRWSSICWTSRRCSRSSAAGSSTPRAPSASYEGRQHLIAYKGRKLTLAELNYPAHVLSPCPAGVLTLPALRWSSSAPRPAECWTDFDLPKTKR